MAGGASRGGDRYGMVVLGMAGVARIGLPSCGVAPSV